MVDGGAGTDTARFYWSSSSYDIGFENGALVVRSDGQRAQQAFSTTLRNVEFIETWDKKIDARTLETIENYNVFNVGSFGLSASALSAKIGIASTFGTSGVDVMNCTSDDDALFGFEGNDTINEFGGNAGAAAGDVLFSVENITASAHDDYVYGDDANNVIDSGLGDDLLRGHNGNDTLIGGSGADNLHGGSGTDTASYAGATVRISLNSLTSGFKPPAFSRGRL